MVATSTRPGNASLVTSNRTRCGASGGEGSSHDIAHGSDEPVDDDAMPSAGAVRRQERTGTGTPSTKARGHSCAVRPRSSSMDARVGPDADSDTPALATTGTGGNVGAGARVGTAGALGVGTTRGAPAAVAVGAGVAVGRAGPAVGAGVGTGDGDGSSRTARSPSCNRSNGGTLHSGNPSPHRPRPLGRRAVLAGSRAVDRLQSLALRASPIG